MGSVPALCLRKGEASFRFLSQSARFVSLFLLVARILFFVSFGGDDVEIPLQRSSSCVMLCSYVFTAE
jgi:hypothetical protein